MDELNRNVGEFLKNRRIMEDMSIDHVSGLSQLSGDSLRSIEEGAPAPLSVIFRLSRIYRVTGVEIITFIVEELRKYNQRLNRN